MVSGNGKSAVMSTQRQAKCSQAIDLRALGLTYKQIGEQLGCSMQEAHRRVTQGLEWFGKYSESLHQVRELECRKLDRMERAWIQEALKDGSSEGKARAFDRVLTCMDRRARYRGLYIQPDQLTQNIDKQVVLVQVNNRDEAQQFARIQQLTAIGQQQPAVQPPEDCDGDSNGPA